MIPHSKNSPFVGSKYDYSKIGHFVRSKNDPSLKKWLFCWFKIRSISQKMISLLAQYMIPHSKKGPLCSLSIWSLTQKMISLLVQNEIHSKKVLFWLNMWSLNQKIVLLLAQNMIPRSENGPFAGSIWYLIEKWTRKHFDGSCTRILDETRKPFSGP